MISNPYEAIVVGSGATGGVAALTLAKAGIRVLVIEAGPKLKYKDAFGSEPSNTFKRILGLINGNYKIQAQHPGFWKANPLLYANEKENPYSHPASKPFLWTQGRQVGGRSLTWGGITLRLSDLDFKAARRDGYGPEWPIEYADLEKHYSSLEKLLKVHGNNDGLEQLPDGEYIDAIPFTESEESFIRRVKNNLELPVIHSRGFGPNTNKEKGEWPISSSIGSTLKEAVKTGKVELLANYFAEKLIMNNEKSLAKGIIVIDKTNRTRHLLESKLIILCASTIQTLRFLLNSEEKNSEEGFIDPSNSLGCNLMDHVSTCRFFAFPDQLIKNSQIDSSKKQILTGAGSFFIPLGSNLKRDNSDFIRGYGIWGGIDRFEPPEFLKRKPRTKTGFLIAHGEVLPNETNKVTLSKRIDEWGVPIPHIECQWGENEKKMVEHMNQTIESIVQAAKGQILPLTDLIRIPFLDAVLKNAIAIQKEAPPPGYYIHEVGGAPMGKDQHLSVVDEWNRLWQCPNVLVVDGACWPTSAWQSPTLTMMAITKRACEAAVKTMPQNE